MKRKLVELQGKIDKSTIWSEISTLDRQTFRKLGRVIEHLNNTISQLHLIDIYRTFHLTKQNTVFFFSSANEAFTKRDHIVGNKISQ